MLTVSTSKVINLSKPMPFQQRYGNHILGIFLLFFDRNMVYVDMQHRREKPLQIKA